MESFIAGTERNFLRFFIGQQNCAPFDFFNQCHKKITKTAAVRTHDDVAFVMENFSCVAEICLRLNGK